MPAFCRNTHCRMPSNGMMKIQANPIKDFL
jgi:hypothetical protein